MASRYNRSCATSLHQPASSSSPARMTRWFERRVWMQGRQHSSSSLSTTKNFSPPFGWQSPVSTKPKVQYSPARIHSNNPNQPLNVGRGVSSRNERHRKDNKEYDSIHPLISTRSDSDAPFPGICRIG